jgi:hypothetical protein
MKDSTNQKVILTFILLCLAAYATVELYHAIGGAISASNLYPDDDGVYTTVDHFTYQLTAVNVNETCSITIDDGPKLSMNFEGVKHLQVQGDTVERDWYTYNLQVNPITEAGNHTWVVFCHYWVWQPEGGYYAEMSSYSIQHHFTVGTHNNTLTPTISPTSTPTATPTPFPVFAAIISGAAAGLLGALFLTIKWKKREKP